MSKGEVYKLLVSKMNEVAVVPPQEIGFFTPIYKKIVPQLKFYPWKVTLIISSLIAFLLYMIFGATLVKLASLLQYGF